MNRDSAQKSNASSLKHLRLDFCEFGVQRWLRKIRERYILDIKTMVFDARYSLVNFGNFDVCQLELPAAFLSQLFASPRCWINDGLHGFRRQTGGWHGGQYFAGHWIERLPCADIDPGANKITKSTDRVILFAHRSGLE
jgi:hypothetical protein